MMHSLVRDVRALQSWTSLENAPVLCVLVIVQLHWLHGDRLVPDPHGHDDGPEEGGHQHEHTQRSQPYQGKEHIGPEGLLLLLVVDGGVLLSLPEEFLLRAGTDDGVVKPFLSPLPQVLNIGAENPRQLT